MGDGIITREEIEAIAGHDPVVSAVIALYRKGLLSWEEAMMEAVKVLVNKVSNYQELYRIDYQNFREPSDWNVIK